MKATLKHLVNKTNELTQKVALLLAENRSLKKEISNLKGVQPTCEVNTIDIRIGVAMG